MRTIFQLGYADDDSEAVELLCECGMPGCRARLDVTLDEYAEVREQPGWFLIKPEHETAAITEIVGQNPRYWIVARNGASA